MCDKITKNFPNEGSLYEFSKICERPVLFILYKTQTNFLRREAIKPKIKKLEISLLTHKLNYILLI